MSTTLTCNKNLLSPVGFRLKVANYPNLEYFANAVTLPSLSLSEAASSYKSVNYAEPGDRINFDTLSIRFSVTEDMDNYLEVFNWMHSLAQSDDDLRSDATLHILTSHNNSSKTVRFTGLFPTDLAALEFDAGTSEVEYLQATATFKFTYFEVI
tara:strand:- start:333 stop:794 length:462 start_codon:yes stop_codon:yes gene_type:complete